MLSGKRAARLMEGRQIVRAECQSALEGGVNGGKPVRMHDIRLHLDNGAQVIFRVEEHPEGAEYGICPLYLPATPARK